MNIGEVEIPIVSDIETEDTASVTEINSIADIDHVSVKHESQVTAIGIEGFLNQEIHSQSLSLEEQVSRVKDLRLRSVEENSINYGEYKGHILVENVDINENLDSVILEEVTIEGRYFPWPEYYSSNEP